ncbi:hypothetical protein HDU79_010278, partial [Rhizoclosmatium sp. JEL0117]
MSDEKKHDVVNVPVEKDADADFHKLNELISEIGMGTYQWKMFYLCGLGWIADNMWLQILATILPQVKAEFSVPSSLSGFGTSCVFIGMIFGSLGWGVVSDIIGRRPAFILTLTLGAIFGTAAAFANNFTVYCALLGLMGVGVGGNLPVDGTIFLEFVPHGRQSLLMLLSLFWPVGAMIGALFGWWLIPTYSCDPDAAFCDPALNRGWRYTLVAMGCVTFAMLLFRLVFIQMRESPKWLITAGRKEEAVAVLHDLAKMNGKEIQVTVDDFPDVQRETASESYKRFAHSLKELFNSPKNLRSTILIWLVWMTISIAYTMFYGFLPEFIKKSSTDVALTLGETYRNFFIQTLCGIPGSIAGTFLVDSRLGRKGTMAGGAIGVGISLFLFTTT